MKTLKWQTGSEELPEHVVSQLCRALERGGLVCVPCNGAYRIMADLGDEKAVTRLIQTKRRTKKAPSLIFIHDTKDLKQLTRKVEPTAKALMKKFWPGDLTVLVDAHPDFPRAIRQLEGSNGKLGVRQPRDPVACQILAGYGRPLLVSSANRANKQGAGSPAQVRKNFASRVDLFLDAGDLKAQSASTVVDVSDGDVTIVRAGQLAEEEILAACQ